MTTTSTRCAAGVAAILLLALAACGSEPGSTTQSTATPAPAAAAPAAARDACALITADEAAKILGSQVKLTPREGPSQRSACDYLTDAFESFSVEVFPAGAEAELTSARSAAKAAVNAVGGQDQVVNDVMGLYRIENLGDEAYFSRRSMSYVRKGDVLLVFETAGLNEPAREHWEALARAALARL